MSPLKIHEKLHPEHGKTAKKNPTPIVEAGFQIGSPSRTRTSDPVVNSHLLYQLSYWGTSSLEHNNLFDSRIAYKFFIGLRKFIFWLMEADLGNPSSTLTKTGETPEYCFRTLSR